MSVDLPGIPIKRLTKAEQAPYAGCVDALLFYTVDKPHIPAVQATFADRSFRRIKQLMIRTDQLEIVGSIDEPAWMTCFLFPFYRLHDN